jgi:hypothetical protein
MAQGSNKKGANVNTTVIHTSKKYAIRGVNSKVHIF